MIREVFINSDKSSEDTCAKSDIFQRLSYEENHLKSNSPADMPVLVELVISPDSENFQIMSKPFYILNLKCKLIIIGFKHSSSLEIFINIQNQAAKDAIFSISFELWLKKMKSFLIISVNLLQKSDYFLGKFCACVPNTLILKGQYEKIHSLLVNELLELKPEMIENCYGMFTIDRLSLILASNNLRTDNEDEVLEIVGVWTNNNSYTDEELANILRLVRWEFVSVKGLMSLLKYPLLKSSSVFRSCFKQILQQKSGLFPNPSKSQPRILYKTQKPVQTFSVFCENLTSILFPIENPKIIEQNVCKIIENSLRVNKLKSKLTSLQSSLNSTMVFNSSTPIPKNLNIEQGIESNLQVNPMDQFFHSTSVTPSLRQHKSHLSSKLTISLLRKKLKRFHSIDSTTYS